MIYYSFSPIILANYGDQHVVDSLQLQTKSYQDSTKYLIPCLPNSKEKHDNSMLDKMKPPPHQRNKKKYQSKKRIESNGSFNDKQNSSSSCKKSIFGYESKQTSGISIVPQ